jgi:hypothetical protein
MLKAGTDAKNAVFVTWTRRLPAYCAASSAVNAREARSMRHVPGFFLGQAARLKLSGTKFSEAGLNLVIPSRF